MEEGKEDKKPEGRKDWSHKFQTTRSVSCGGQLKKCEVVCGTPLRAGGT